MNPANDPLARHLSALRHAVQEDSERCLRANRNGEGISQLVRKADLLLDAEIGSFHAAVEDAAATGRGKTVDCKAGCSSCCYRVVPVAVAEVVAIWQDIEARFTEEEREQLRERAAVYMSDSAAVRDENLNLSRAACPLLVNGLCSVYETRPAACRGRNSVDVRACVQQKENPTVPVQVPSLYPQDAMAEAAVFGMRMAEYFDALPTDFVELGYALHLLDQHAAVVTSFFDGKNELEPAGILLPRDPLTDPEFLGNVEPAFRSPREVSDPSGELTARDRSTISAFRKPWLHEAKFKHAMGMLSKSNAAQAMARITVPRAYREEAEIEEWRGHFVQAMRDFDSASFPGAEAFNALSIHDTLPLAYQGLNNRDILAEHGRIMVSNTTERCLPELSAPIEKRNPGGKIRVGYLSANMKNSNGSRWALGWLKNHAEDIETYSFFVGGAEDLVSLRFQKESDHYFHLTRGVVENARFIRSLNLDILVFTDIGLHGRNLQYATMRLAPVQCTAWGHAETSGLPTIDHYLSSDLMEPENAQEHYTENLVRLPNSGLCYPRITSRIPQELDRKHFGLPEGLLYVVPHIVTTCLPHFDWLFKAINDRTGLPIVFIELGYESALIVTKERLRKAGVRTHWVKALTQPEFLRFLQLADVILDTPSWSGGNTTLEALTFGKPVITLPGTLMRARHSLAFLKIAGAEGLVARDEEDYINLACDRERQHNAMKNMEPAALFEDKECVAALDSFLRKVAFA
jgi:predicted O-linked N-acetylglucosamine transferase (SPINDLY family)